MKRVFLFTGLMTLMFSFTAVFALADEEPIAKTIYRSSENRKYLLEVQPVIELGTDTIKKPIERKALTIFVYQKKSRKSQAPKPRSSWWHEIAFFRAKHISTYGGVLAEVKCCLISNDGNYIILQSRLSPLRAANDAKELFIYNQNGDLLGSFSSKDLFDKKGMSLDRIHQVAVDHKEDQLVVSSIEGKVMKVALSSICNCNGSK